jgi:hypothetical protein
MEVRWRVVAEVHPDHDSVEAADRGHDQKIFRAPDDRYRGLPTAGINPGNKLSATQGNSEQLKPCELR